MRLLRNRPHEKYFLKPNKHFYPWSSLDNADNLAVNKNESNQLISSIIIIQRSWRDFLNRRRLREAENIGSIGDSQLTTCCYVDIHSINSACRRNDWNMSEESCIITSSNHHPPRDVRNGEYPGAKLDTKTTQVEATAEHSSSVGYSSSVAFNSELLPLDSTDATRVISNSLASKRGIESDPDSIVSDYSEINEPIREHLASVQIIRREDLDLGNAFPASPRRVTLAPILKREPDEDDDAYEKRVRKTNLLSLAQEFAALKRVNANALPFDLHEKRFLHSGLSRDDDTISDNDSDNVETPLYENPLQSFSSTLGDMKIEAGLTEDPAGDLKVNGAVRLDSSDIPDVVPNVQGRQTAVRNSPLKVIPSGERSFASPLRNRKENNEQTCDTEEIADSSVEEFDVYTMESTLPAMDWQKLEEQLMKSAEDEQHKWPRSGDREEIRRKLAMSADDEYFHDIATTNDAEYFSPYRRSNLQTRLHTGMNLQVCYVNDAAVDDDAAELSSSSNNTSNLSTLSGSCPQPDVVPESSAGRVKGVNAVSIDEKKEEMADDDFFSRQAYLQEEAKLALAQVRPMAHMQLQLEKQQKKKSPIAEIIGIPNFSCEKLKKVNWQMLTRMNLAQLQVVVNDLHAQIEVLNIDLMQSLVDRDELHMAQDSMLVDIEDLTGRAKEYADRINKRALKKCAGK